MPSMGACASVPPARTWCPVIRGVPRRSGWLRCASLSQPVKSSRSLRPFVGSSLVALVPLFHCGVGGTSLSSLLSWRWLVSARSLLRVVGWVVLLSSILLLLLRGGLSGLLRSLAAASPSTPVVSAVLYQPAVSGSVIGSPSLSASFVDRVLSAYHSPAVGLGAALYADSVQFHLDDAYALAFFLHESAFGTTGVARYTHSLGNIICSGYATCYEGFRAYPSWQVGAWDWFRLIRYEYLPRGLTTVQTIVPVYAPSSDGNDPSAYIKAVLSAVATWRAGRLWV